MLAGKLLSSPWTEPLVVIDRSTYMHELRLQWASYNHRKAYRHNDGRAEDAEENDERRLHLCDVWTLQHAMIEK